MEEIKEGTPSQGSGGPKTGLGDGGPAFPQHEPTIPPGHYYTGPAGEGMSLRDYFAAKAMQGQAQFEGMEGSDPKHWAAMAYQVADAMLRARAGA